MHFLGVLCTLWASWVTMSSASVEAVVPLYSQPLHLPRCCPPGQAFSEGSCGVHLRVPFIPQVVINETFVEAGNVVKGPPTTINCEVQGGDPVVVKVARGQAIIFISIPGLPSQLVWNPPDSEHPMAIQNYCLGMTPEKTFVAKFCYKSPAAFENNCGAKYCARKCCNEGEEMLKHACVQATGSPWTLPFSSKEDPSVRVRPHKDLNLAFGAPQCPNLLVYEDFLLDSKGDLHLSMAKPLFHTQYCVDRMVVDGGKTQDVALACHVEREIPTCSWKSRILDPILMGVSCFFLLFTVAVYLSVSELRNSLNGRCLIAFAGSMFISFVTIIVLGFSRENFGSFQCTFTAFFALTFTLATFFWLNIICIRIWSDIRKQKQEESNSLWFLALCGYGFGCPLLVALIGYGLDATESDAIRPHFVLPHCWFRDNTARWAYQYGIILALLMVNLFLFVWSFVTLVRRLQTWMIHRSSATKRGATLFFWLFFIMGITWILELISWHVQKCSAGEIIIDIITALQGFFVFLAAVCFRGDLKLQGRWWTRVPLEDHDDPSNGRYAPSNTELGPASRSAD